MTKKSPNRLGGVIKIALPLHGLVVLLLIIAAIILCLTLVIVVTLDSFELGTKLPAWISHATAFGLNNFSSVIVSMYLALLVSISMPYLFSRGISRFLDFVVVSSEEVGAAIQQHCSTFDTNPSRSVIETFIVADLEGEFDAEDIPVYDLACEFNAEDIAEDEEPQQPTSDVVPASPLKVNARWAGLKFDSHCQY